MNNWKMGAWNNQDWDDQNTAVIAEFRANGGKLADKPQPHLLLTTTGAKSGRKYTKPLLYLKDPNSDDLVIIGSKGGFPKNPDWYYNLVANPRVTVEVGSEVYEAQAIVTQGEERERLFKMWSELYTIFATFQKSVTRKIPMIRLHRIDSA